MTEYVSSALFVYTQESEHLLEHMQSNGFGARITAIEFDAFEQDPDATLEGVGHVVVAGSLDIIKVVIGLAIKSGFSLGIVPLQSQKNLKKYFSLPGEPKAAVELALQQASGLIDIILCNGKMLLFKAVIGRLPVLDSPGNVKLWNVITRGRNRLKGLKLLGFQFTTGGKKKVNTAACGCMIVQHPLGSLASRMIRHRSGFSDGMISLLVAAPFSSMEYFKFIVQVLQRNSERRRIASTMGYIQSPEVLIESERELDVFIDDERSTHTPVHCEVVPNALKINIGTLEARAARKNKASREQLDIRNLPMGIESAKAKNKTIPFFSYASEERFRDLFTALRDDARMSSAYVILMFLSTMLATAGLYLNSASVVIGAMLLAPLMAPIVSLAMGLLRQEKKLQLDSAKKIGIGIALALFSAALTARIFTNNPVTDEMLARLSPSLLDLAVAVFAGIAGAYTKSYKEILQGLAGVAIAVALVPPLAVAGTGLGRLDFYFFSQAFLLFSTNLVGIVLAAALTFRVLGYSPVVRDKRSITAVALILALIAIPLYFASQNIYEKHALERHWKQVRFLVNEKYMIIRNVQSIRKEEKLIVSMDILARGNLTRSDMDLLQKKIQQNYPRQVIIRANVVYIL